MVFCEKFAELSIFIFSMKIIDLNIAVFGLGAVVFQMVLSWESEICNVLAFVMGVIYFVAPLERIVEKMWGKEIKAEEIIEILVKFFLSFFSNFFFNFLFFFMIFFEVFFRFSFF